MRNTLLPLFLLAFHVHGQAVLSPPANWTPLTPWVTSALELDADPTQPDLIAELRWDPFQAAFLGIPDPRLAPTTEVLVGIQGPGSIPAWTPYGLAWAQVPVLTYSVGAADWTSPDGGTTLAIRTVLASPRPILGGIPILAQGLIVHRFGAPDVAYFSAPVPVWL